MQKILSLIITIAILYSLIQLKMGDHNTSGNKETILSAPSQKADNTETVPTGNFIEKTISNVLINVLKTEDGRLFFENILQPSNKPLAGSNHSYKINNIDFIHSLFKINTFGQGTIGPVSCGHIVTIHYQILTTNNSIVDEKTKTYTLGSRSIIPGLDSVIVGMMVGQTRQALIPAKYAYYDAKYQRPHSVNPDALYKVNITLKEVIPQNFVKNDEVKIFDDEIAYKMPLMCGDGAVFEAKITRLSDAEVLYDSELTGKKINITIGDLNYPMIFSYALHSKIPIGTRTVIAKGKSFQSLGAKISNIFPKEQLPSDEYFMLELKNFE